VTLVDASGIEPKRSECFRKAVLRLNQNGALNEKAAHRDRTPMGGQFHAYTAVCWLSHSITLVRA
jgi:hypothetical protein